MVEEETKALENLNLVVIGNRFAGKSTLIGHLLFKSWTKDCLTNDHKYGLFSLAEATFGGERQGYRLAVDHKWEIRQSTFDRFNLGRSDVPLNANSYTLHHKDFWSKKRKYHLIDTPGHPKYI